MKKFISQIFIVLLLAVGISAQNETNEAKPFDMFSDIQIGELFARLDALGSELLKNEQSAALIKVYGGTKARKHFVFPYTWSALMKAYLTGSRGFEPQRIRIQNCALDEVKVRAELFLVPKNHEIPKCTDELIAPKETVLFTYRHNENPYIVYDNPYYIPGLEEATSIVTNRTLTELLNKSPESRIFLIGYLGTNLHNKSRLNNKGEYIDYEIRKPDKSQTLKTMMKEIQNGLIKNGVSSSRISLINGGYQDSTRNVEIWFVPKGGEIPKPKPDYFPKKKRNLK